MKRLLPILFLAWSALGADGDVLSAAVAANGWELNVTFSGMATNGTFDLGIGTDNSVSGAKVVLTVQSPGYADDASTNVITRTIYGMKPIRFAYPGQAYINCVVSGSDVICPISLSELVYSGDVITSCTIGAGVYTSGAIVSATGTPTATNGSTQGYSRCIANWSWPGWQRVSTSPMVVRAVAFHTSGQQGRPVRLVKFTAADQHSHTATALVTVPTIDRTMGDATSICEYVGSLDVSSFTALDNIRCDFAAYPWLGDSTSVLDTSDNVNTWPTGYYCSITNLCDTANTYGRTIAIVATDGVDANGVAITNTLDTSSPPAAFLTINGALLAIQGTNNRMYGHNDVGGGTVYLQNGNFAWTGGSGTYTTKPKTWVTIACYPTNTIDEALIGSQSGKLKICDRDKFVGITLTNMWANDNIGPFYNSDALWWDQCKIDIVAGSGASKYITRQIACWYVTRNTVNNISNGSFVGFAPPADKTGAAAIVRGNTINGSSSHIPWVFIGNKRTATNMTAGDSVFLTTYRTGGAATAIPASCIVAFNDLRNLWWNSGYSVSQFYTAHATTGFALVQNVFEKVSNDTQYLVQVCADGFTSGATNLVIWNNTILGQRYNAVYNDTGTSAVPITHVSFCNNVTDNNNIKSDTYATSPSGGRTGNWECVFGVGYCGNCDLMTTGIGVPGSFPNEYLGVSSDTFGSYGMWGRQTAGTKSTNYAAFVTRAAWDGVNQPGNGNGNYRLQSGSALIPFNTKWVLPYDIEGVPRGGFDPPGAYASASPRKGAGFFSP